MMDFIIVTPADLRGHWPRIKESLDAVQAKAPEDWIAEDVYHAIKSGSAVCHIGVWKQGYAGLIVTTLRRAEFSGEPSLHVWIAHNQGDADVFGASLAMLRETATKNGLKKITFSSPRPGWAKRFKPISALYEVDA